MKLKALKNWVRNHIRKHREKKALKIVASHCNEIFISGGSYQTSLSRKTHLGKNPNFNGMTIKGHGEVFIGDNFHSGEGCLMLTTNHNYMGNALPYDSTNINKKIIIGDNVWFGDRVIVLGGVTIGDGAILQAGSVVISNIPPLGIAGGNPAKVFKYRDKNHYDKLIREAKFH